MIPNEELNEAEFEKHTWKIISSYFEQNRGLELIRHVISSYDDFVSNKIYDIIEGFNPIQINYNYLPDKDLFEYQININMKNPEISKPIIYEKDGSTKLITPQECRQRNFYYAGTLYIDMYIEVLYLVNNVVVHKNKVIKKINIGKIPIMVRSKYCVLKDLQIQTATKECKYDYGGYFITNGNEKVIVSQDRIAENKTYVFLDSKLSAYSHIAEIRSVLDNKFGAPKLTTLKLSAKSTQFGKFIRAIIHHIRIEIPLFILFRALGIESDKEIIQYIVLDLDASENKELITELKGSSVEANNCLYQKDALIYMSKFLNISGYPKEYIQIIDKKINIIKDILKNDFLPHCGDDFQKKALYLGFMVRKLLLCYFNRAKLDDRDSYLNKKIDTPGILMANIFRQYYGKVIRDMKNMLFKEIQSGPWKATTDFVNIINICNLYKIIKSNTIESGLKYSLATGNWGIKNNMNKTKQGVAQVLNRLTYQATISHLRRINTPMEKGGKLIQPRKLHSTQWGIVCSAECFAPDTPILLWNGTIKRAEDIVVGDYLIDDKGNPTKVRTTCEGYKTMYEIIPTKKNFMSYTVTDNHILTLKVKKHKIIRNMRGHKMLKWFDKNLLRYKHKEFHNDNELEKFKSIIDDDDIIDITIEKYLSLPINIQKELYLFKSDGINWKHKDVLLDPYILGMWLGDGMSSGFAFATADKELLDKWIEWGKSNDATIKHHGRYRYGLSSTINNTQTGISCNKTEKAPLKKLLDKYDLVNNKHIPLDYLVNDRKIRLAVLAGLIDTDGNVRANGHEIRICQGEANYRIIYDTEFLARSLGFSCHLNDGICSYTVNGEKKRRPYKELTITGEKLYEIPTVLPRKKLNQFENPITIKRCSSFLQSSFQLIKKNIQPFYGWQLEGKGRFLLKDMSITHNTPEGASVGLVKNLSVNATITISSNSENVRNHIMMNNIIPFNGNNFKEFYENTTVYLNGDIIGYHKEPHIFYKKMKLLKRNGIINIHTSIAWYIQQNKIDISTESGRCIRPLYIVDEGNKLRLTKKHVLDIYNKKITWKNLVSKQTMFYDDDKLEDSSIVEFIDTEESNTLLFAMKLKDLHKGIKANHYPRQYTHLEMHPALALGILASNIPFPDHNQAPRNCYQASMGKQAMGVYASNFRNRLDTMGNILNYPQRPLVRTRMSDIINCNELPCGINVIVAIMTYTGFNQEDSVMLNKSAVDRGLFNSTYYRTYKEQCNKNHSTGEEEIFCKPDFSKTKGIKPFNYDKLDENGFVPENTLVNQSDIIVGKVMPNRVNNLFDYKDNSITIKSNENCFIDANCSNNRYFKNTNNEGYIFGKIRTRSYRIPTIGDKLSCYTPDHDVLTDKGWINITELTMDHKVASLVGERLIYQNPIALQEYDVDDEIYHIKSNQVDLLVTKNHRMYVSNRGDRNFIMENAENIINKRRYYKKNCNLWIPDVSNNIPKEFIIIDNNLVKFEIESKLIIDINDWLQFIGLWYAEGWVKKNTKYANFAADKPRVKEYLTNFCNKYNLEIYKDKYHSSDNEENRWRITSKAIGNYLEIYSVGAINKKLPEWTWLLNREQCKFLIKGMLLGDGHIMNNGTERYDTSSVQLADDFQKLCLHAGYSCNKIIKYKAGHTSIKKDGYKITQTVDAYRLTIIKKQNEPIVNKNYKLGFPETSMDKFIKYTGKVYCCTVPEGNGIIYVRRNGIPVWSGNSRHG